MDDCDCQDVRVSRAAQQRCRTSFAFGLATALYADPTLSLGRCAVKEVEGRESEAIRCESRDSSRLFLPGLWLALYVEGRDKHLSTALEGRSIKVAEGFESGLFGLTFCVSQIRS